MNIILFHIGYQEYLKHTIEQLKYSNPNANIFLLGTKENDQFEGIEHIKIENYINSLSEFAKYYDHMSSNNVDFESWCFARWFVINAFVKQRNINRFFYTDSDVLFYRDLNVVCEPFKHCKFTTTNRISFGISLFNHVNSLNEFCEFIVDAYKEQNFVYKKVESHYECLKQCNMAGGVNDMSFVNLFCGDRYNNPGEVGEMSSIIEESFSGNRLSTFDHNINQSDGYEMKDGIKKIKWVKGIPTVRHVRLNKDIIFNCIHFAGYNTKNLMKRFIT